MSIGQKTFQAMERKGGNLVTVGERVGKVRKLGNKVEVWRRSI